MKHLPLILVALFVAGVQVACTYWIVHRVQPVAQRLEQVHVDVANGVIYANFDTTSIGMTPRAALQMQVELTRTIAQIQRSAPQVR